MDAQHHVLDQLGRQSAVQGLTVCLHEGQEGMAYQQHVTALLANSMLHPDKSNSKKRPKTRVMPAEFDSVEACC